MLLNASRSLPENQLKLAQNLLTTALKILPITKGVDLIEPLPNKVNLLALAIQSPLFTSVLNNEILMNLISVLDKISEYESPLRHLVNNHGLLKLLQNPRPWTGRCPSVCRGDRIPGTSFHPTRMHQAITGKSRKSAISKTPSFPD